MLKTKLILIASIGVIIISFLIIQSQSQQQYLDITLSNLQQEYKNGDIVTTNIILDGYWKLCGSLKLELQNHVTKTFHIRQYQCTNDASPAKIHEIIPVEFQLENMTSGTYAFKVFFNNKSIEQTLKITE